MRELQNGRRKEIQKKSLDSHDQMCEQYKKSGYFCTKVYIFKNKSVYFQKQKGTKNYKSVQKCTKTYMNA